MPRLICAVIAASMLAACGSPRPSGVAGGSPLAVREIANAATKDRRVILLGLDGADWNLLDPYIAAGAMPNLAQVVADGASGRLRTIDPPLSPIVWTTMLTGTTGLEHGILDFVQFNPTTGQKEPISSTERRAPAIWNMANMAGKRAAAFGMWATYPAEAIDGLIVSDRLFTFLFKEATPPVGIVYPADREAWARAGLDQAERRVDYAAVHEYLPWLGEPEYNSVADSSDPYANPISALRRMLVETTVYRDLSVDWIRREHPDVAVVYLQSTDTVGHVFAPYAPPQQSSISDAEYAKYSSVPERFFRHIDAIIGEYRALATSEHAALLIASDHGFVWGDGRPAKLSSVATASAAKWHAPDGIYAVVGPGVTPRPGHGGQGSVQQICATMLALAGLPPGRDVEGDPVPGVAAVNARRADYSAHYKPAVAVAASGRSDLDKESLANLRALGYIGATESTAAPPGSRGSTRTPGSYNNEGLILRSKNKLPQAVEAFEHALALDPNLASAAWNLSDILYARGQDLNRSDELLVRAFSQGVPDGLRYVIGRAMAYQRVGQLPRSVALLDAAIGAKGDEPDLWLFRGRYRVEAGDCGAASRDFDRAIALAPRNASAYASRGVARLCAGDRAGARAAFERSLAIDPTQTKVRDYLQSTR